MVDNTNITTILSLLERAVNSSKEGITISNMTEEDRPLIYANKGFEQLTSYRIDEVIGKNCRFLQGKDTQKEPVAELRRAVKNGEETTVELLNYKKDGTSFWNRLSITPLKNKEGNVTHYVGIQSDITELKETKNRLLAANNELQSFRDRITFDLEQASKAQQFILPSKLPSNDKVKFSALYKPMEQIGGDYYDVIELKPNVFGLMIADVTGHGIPAALLTFMTSFAFKEVTKKNMSTAKVVSRTNEMLVNKMPNGAFITMFYAIYDANSKELRYTQAGHPPGYVIRKHTKEIIPLDTVGSLVGVFRNDKVQYEEMEISVKKGDKLVLYTDAINEVRDRNNRMIETSELINFLHDQRQETIDNCFEKLHQYGLKYNGKSTYDDDFTLLGFEVLS